MPSANDVVVSASGTADPTAVPDAAGQSVSEPAYCVQSSKLPTGSTTGESVKLPFAAVCTDRN